MSQTTYLPSAVQLAACHSPSMLKRVVVASRVILVSGIPAATFCAENFGSGSAHVRTSESVFHDDFVALAPDHRPLGTCCLPLGYLCHRYSSASGSVWFLTAPSACPAFRANTN
jgi:hypothetical protein